MEQRKPQRHVRMSLPEGYSIDHTFQVKDALNLEVLVIAIQREVPDATIRMADHGLVVYHSKTKRALGRIVYGHFIGKREGNTYLQTYSNEIPDGPDLGQKLREYVKIVKKGLE